MKKITVTFLALMCGLPAIAQTTRERLTDHVYTLASDSLQGRKFGTTSALAAAEYIAGQFADAGLETYGDAGWLHPFKVGQNEGNNVIGVIRGNDPALADEWIIIGAHFDHLGISRRDSLVFHGADDNASGTAALIETARALSARRGELRRSVMFAAFDGEESGLYGSAQLAKNPPQGKVKLMFSMDMVGWLGAGKGLEMVGVGMVRNGNDIFAGVNSADRPELLLKRFDRAIMTGSDHEPFAKVGIPAIYITTGLESPYHKPEDTADKIDYPGLTRITDYMSAATLDVASRAQLESSGRAALKHRNEATLEAGVMASIGSGRHIYKGGALNGKSGWAWSAGVWTQINFRGGLALRPAVVYDQLNVRWPVDHATRTSTGFVSRNVTVPLDAMIKLRLGQHTSAPYFYLFAGGYYSRPLSVDIGGEEIPVSGEGAFRRNEWGLRYGIGLRIYHLWVEATGTRGLTPIMEHGGKISNSSARLSVGYRF